MRAASERNDATRQDGFERSAVLAAAVFLVMAVRAVARGADHGFWAPALLMVGPPAVLVSYGLRLRRHGGPGMVASGIVFALMILAPGALLGSPRWPDVMVGEAILALGILSLLAGRGRPSSAAAVVTGSILFAVALTMALYA